MMVDEADFDPMGSVRSGSPSAGGKRLGDPMGRAAMPPKRKAGPIPAHVQARRPSSPVSPVPTMAAGPVSPVAPRRPATPVPLQPASTEVPSGRPPEVRC